MKLVLLAAGKGKRMGESSNHTPKPLLTYKGKNLLQYKLENMPESIEEVIIVIGYLGEQVIETFGNKYIKNGSNQENKDIPITYVWQKELLGTAHSLLQAKDAIGDSSFIVLMGDDVYGKDDQEAMVAHHEKTGEWSVLLETSNIPMSTGKCIVDEKGNLVDIVEDPEAKNPINKMYTGGCLLTPEVFNIEMTPLPGSNEFGLPQTFVKVSRDRNIKAFDASYWKRVTVPEDLEN